MKVIDFKDAKCRHCYKCVRHCAVKAITVRDEQARIMVDHCINCGRCLEVCPQNAKTFASDLDRVKGYLGRGEKVIISIAPSYLGVLDYRKPDKKYLEELLSVLNLKERRRHLPGQLSGGQQQRVAIGRALITRPALILADEPTGNLDTQNTSEVVSLLKEASRRYEQTILMITHSRSIAQTADRILQVSDGVLTDFGRCRE